MGKFLSDYYWVTSPTGKNVNVVRLNGLSEDNPWIEVSGRRYRKDKNGNIELRQFNAGDWVTINELDKDYWTNYVKEIDKKIDGKQPQNFFSYFFNRMDPIKKQGGLVDYMNSYKNGSDIHIKKENKDKFTEYCHGKVTEECIARGKHSKNPLTRKRATFADNVRRWKHQEGGTINYMSVYGETI